MCMAGGCSSCAQGALCAMTTARWRTSVVSAPGDCRYAELKTRSLTRFPGSIQSQSTMKSRMNWRAVSPPSHALSLTLIVSTPELIGSLSSCLMKLAFVIGLLKRNAFLEPIDVKNFPLLKWYSDVWPRLIIEDDLLKHFNERAVSTRIFVPAAL